MKLPRPLEVYLDGYCHLFALAMREERQHTIFSTWDMEPMDDDLNPIPGPVLVHAFTKDDFGNYWDASGRITESHALYDHGEVNEGTIEAFDLLRMHALMSAGLLTKPLPGEIDALRQFIRESPLYTFNTPS